jgi:RNA polymerase sigma-70 factor (ECF subfamily)
MNVGQRNPQTDLDRLLERGFRYAVSLTHDNMQAEDLVQEACVRMVRIKHPWHATYFFTIIRNRFIEQYRHKKKFPFIALDEIGKKDIPEERLLRDEENIVTDAESLEKALSSLKTEEREMLYLFVVEGYTASEISKMTSRPRNTVLSIVHRTRIKLRAFLENEVRCHYGKKNTK